MTRQTFESHIQSHPQLVFFREPQGGNYYIQNYRNDRFEMPAQDFEEQSWEHLEAVLLGKRQPKVMRGMTRIIGYYALLHNFNRSKYQEVLDRRKGNYTLEETVRA